MLGPQWAQFQLRIKPFNQKDFHWCSRILDLAYASLWFLAPRRTEGAQEVANVARGDGNLFISDLTAPQYFTKRELRRYK